MRFNKRTIFGAIAHLTLLTATIATPAFASGGGFEQFISPNDLPSNNQSPYPVQGSASEDDAPTTLEDLSRHQASSQHKLVPLWGQPYQSANGSICRDRVGDLLCLSPEQAKRQGWLSPQ